MFIFLTVSVMILSGFAELKRGILMALAVSLGGYLLFIVFVGARFPQGPVENLLRLLG
jgi:hypothetical protein